MNTGVCVGSVDTEVRGLRLDYLFGGGGGGGIRMAPGRLKSVPFAF